MQGNVLVTGATGFVGTRVIRELIETTDVTVFALVRAEGNATPEQRLAWLDAANEVRGVTGSGLLGGPRGEGSLPRALGTGTNARAAARGARAVSTWEDDA